MEKKTLRDVHVSIRDLYTRAIDGSSHGKFDYAVKLMKEVVKKVPALEEARTKLREFEKEKTKKLGLFAKLSASMGAGAAKKKIAEALESNPLQALSMCEEELAKNLNNPDVLKLLADAAEKSDAHFIAIEAMNTLLEYSPNNENTLRRLLELYRQEDNIVKVEEILQTLSNRHPDDLALQAEWRTSTLQLKAFRSEQERREIKKRVKENKDAVTLQLEDATIHDERQAKALITKYTRELQKGDSLDVRRKLAEAYLVAQNYDAAIRELEYVAEKLGALDPVLDKNIERGYLAKFDAVSADLEKRPEAYENAEAQVAQFKQQREEYRMDRALQRRQTYPNDTMLRFDLGVLYFERGQYREAIAEFAEAERSPQRKGPSLVYIGRCHMALEEYPQAVEAFEQGVQELFRMDKRKLEAMYFLADALEHCNEKERAIGYFSEIQEINPNFQDVGERLIRLK